MTSDHENIQLFASLSPHVSGEACFGEVPEGGEWGESAGKTVLAG